MLNLGKVRPGSTLYFPFDSFGTNGESLTITGLAVTDIEIYKDGSTTQRGSDNGYTLLDTDGIDLDGLTGIHGLSVDLADNSTAGFYAAGSKYWVVVSSVTINTQTVSFILGYFEIAIENAVLNTTVATLASQTSMTLTAGPAEDDAINGWVAVFHDVASAVQMGHAVVLDYTGSTKTVTLAAGTTFTVATTDNVGFLPPVNLSYILGAAVSTSTAQLGVNAVQAGGTAWGSGAITAASIAANALTAAKIATDAIGAAQLAADAVTEIQSGLATAAALDTVDNFLDTEVAAIKAVTDLLPNAGALTSLATQASVNTIDDFLDTEVAAILAAVDTEVAAIKTVTDALPNAGALTDLKADTAAILDDTGTSGVVVAAASKTGYRLSSTGVSDIWAQVIEGAWTAIMFMRLFASALFGKLSGAATATVSVRDVDDTKNRIVSTVDANGNRSAFGTLDGT